MLLLAGWSVIGAGGSQGRAPRHASRSAIAKQQAALARLVARPIPSRDLYRLTDELRLRPPRPIPRVIRHSSPNYPVGHQDSFKVLSEDRNHYFVVHATIRAETPHLYIYIQDSVHVSAAGAQKAAQTFERSIYPTDRSFFGSEWNPGVDGDPHITCLVADLRGSGAAGDYSAEDEYPRRVNPYSNERERIDINAVATTPGDGSFDLTMSHEFQHMIHWHMHPHDNAWLNEGMSMLAEQLNKHAPAGEPGAFLYDPSTQLNSWSLSPASSVSHYGAAYLFLSYVYDRFGRGMIRDLLADRKYTDFELLDDVLRKRHIHETSLQLFKEWTIANYLNDRSVAGGIYGYKHFGDRVHVFKTETTPFSEQGSLPAYGTQYVVVNAPSGGQGARPGWAPFQLRFSAPTGLPVVGNGDRGPFWWSNRGDMSDTRLYRAVDLTKVHPGAQARVSLHFRTWYDIEKNYDYGYVEASTDGGKTWTALRGTHTTTANPNGASYGNGYTGVSKGWTAETVDLSRYAGRKILLRFQYVTDDEYNGQSWAVKDVTIPAIGFRDAYTGWHAQGFVPVSSNTLPSPWTVQLISYTDKGVTVSQLPISQADKGSILIDPAKQGLKKLVVVLFTAAPKTTVQTTYQLSAVSS